MKEYFKHISLPTQTIEPYFDDTKIKSVFKATQNIIASVVNLSDKAIVEAIKEFAIEQDFTEIYLMDEDFIITALKNELERRTKNGRG